MRLLSFSSEPSSAGGKALSTLNVDEPAVLEKLVAPRLPEPVTVLVLGDSQPLLGSVTAVLEEHHYKFCACPRPASLGSLLLERSPEAVVVDLDDVSGLGSDFQYLLHDVPRDPVIPVIGVCSGETSQQYRLKAIGAGLWDVLEVPLKATELVAKLHMWIWMMRDVDEMKSGVLIDVESGHYSFTGIMRRLREQAALARRSGEALSCVVFGFDPVQEGANADGMELAGIEFSLALHDLTRDSDVVGRLEPLKFAVLTPQTPPTGAYKLAERVTSWSLSRSLGGQAMTFSAGVAGVDQDDARTLSVLERPEQLIVGARRAVNAARASGTAQVAVAWGGIC